MEWSWGASGVITYLSSLAEVYTKRKIRAILVNEGSRDDLANQEGSQESYLAVKKAYTWFGMDEKMGRYENKNGGHGYLNMTGFKQ